MGLIDGAEFMHPLDLRKAQELKWRIQREYVMAFSDLYRELWGGEEPPDSLDTIQELPFVDKAMLRESQANNPPFGAYLASPPEKVIRFHRTSGTTGQAMNLALSVEDAQMTALVGARSQRASGLGPGHRVVHCLNYRMWMGGLTDHMSLEATGATAIPFGVGSTQLLIRTIQALQITAISCTPSYPAVMEQVVEEHFPEIEPRDLGLQLGLFGGEAGLDNLDFRKKLEEVWGFKARNANYGVTDVLCNFAGQCEQHNDLHFMGLDVIFPELIHAESGDPLPWKSGETGELVLTHLEKECQPLVRFRTADIITITGTDRCGCGRTTTRFRVIGRSDDMVVVRGINVFPTMIAAVLNTYPSLSGEYRIVLSGEGPYDRLPLEVEVMKGVEPTERLQQSVAEAIKRENGVTAEVELLPARSLPRTSGKTKRVYKGETP